MPSEQYGIDLTLWSVYGCRNTTLTKAPTATFWKALDVILSLFALTVCPSLSRQHRRLFKVCPRENSTG